MDTTIYCNVADRLISRASSACVNNPSSNTGLWAAIVILSILLLLALILINSASGGYVEAKRELAALKEELESLNKRNTSNRASYEEYSSKYHKLLGTVSKYDHISEFGIRYAADALKNPLHDNSARISELEAMIEPYKAQGDSISDEDNDILVKLLRERAALKPDQRSFDVRLENINTLKRFLAEARSEV